MADRGELELFTKGGKAYVRLVVGSGSDDHP